MPPPPAAARRRRNNSAAGVAGQLTAAYLHLDELCEDGAGSGKVWVAIEDVGAAREAVGLAVERQAEADARAAAAAAQDAAR